MTPSRRRTYPNPMCWRGTPTAVSSRCSSQVTTSDVAGLVLIDAVHPEYYRRRLRVLKKLLPREKWLALKRDAGKIPPELIDPERLDIVASQAQKRRSLHDSPLRRMPLFVLTHRRLDPSFYPPEWPADAEEHLWRVLQAELANLLPNSRLVVARRSGTIFNWTNLIPPETSCRRP